MTPRSLFNIILKILSIFFIKDFIALIPQLISMILYFIQPDTVSFGIWSAALTLLTLITYGVITHYLILKTDFVIDTFKFDKGFKEEAFSVNIHRSAILSISIIVIGGFLLVDEIPNFCRLLFSYFQSKSMSYGQMNPLTMYLIISAVKLIVGLILVTGQREIVNLIELKRKA
jgi:hypothetical protein